MSTKLAVMMFAALLLAGVSRGQVSDQAQQSLREIAAKRGISIGTAVRAARLADPDYKRVLVREFNQFEPEREMKWDIVRPDRGAFRFEPADQIVNLALANGAKARGHVLVWHKALPNWLQKGEFTPAQLRNLLREHITKEVSHFAGRVYAWDVVNEAFNQDGSLRETLWYNKPGVGLPGTYGYIEDAFRTAHAADPNALLFYNDYEIEDLNLKSDAVYKMVADFRRRGVPIDGVGFQAHLRFEGIGDEAEDLAKSGKSRMVLAHNGTPRLVANLKRFVDLGVQVQITELDVRMPLRADAKPTPWQLQTQAEIYRSVIEGCLAVKGCTAIQLWGFTDRYSWIPAFFKGYGAALPLDENYKPKPAWIGLTEALESAPAPAR